MLFGPSNRRRTENYQENFLREESLDGQDRIDEMDGNFLRRDYFGNRNNFLFLKKGLFRRPQRKACCNPEFTSFSETIGSGRGQNVVGQRSGDRSERTLKVSLLRCQGRQVRAGEARAPNPQGKKEHDRQGGNLKLSIGHKPRLTITD